MGVTGKGWGVKHWIFQRTSNALIVIFAFALVYTVACGVSYEELQALMAKPLTKVYLAVTLAFACLNSVLAGWQIAGDYAKKIHVSGAAMVVVCALVTLAYFVFGLSIIF